MGLGWFKLRLNDGTLMLCLTTILSRASRDSCAVLQNIENSNFMNIKTHSAFNMLRIFICIANNICMHNGHFTRIYDLRIVAENCRQWRGYTWNKCISKLFQPSSTSVWNIFISGRAIMSKIISKLFQRIIATCEYCPTCSMSLK